MDKNTAIENFKLAIRKFEKIFPDWKPRIEDPNLEIMIAVLKVTISDKNYEKEKTSLTSLLEELIKINQTLSAREA